jgi:hydroxylamine reductase (hybrid-cluster protein)
LENKKHIYGNDPRFKVAGYIQAKEAAKVLGMTVMEFNCVSDQIPRQMVGGNNGGRKPVYLYRTADLINVPQEVVLSGKQIWRAKSAAGRTRAAVARRENTANERRANRKG